ncbi:MAG: type II toxin-antitoxin system Phd/YefM family antitoxin [Candidatus Margulisiibacteriota bacterium]
MNVTKARQHLYNLIHEVNENHQPIEITSKNGNAVLISSEDWEAIQETLYLEQIPGMRNSIKKGMAEPLSACSPQSPW